MKKSLSFILVVSAILFICLTPNTLMSKVAQASISRGDWEQLTGKDAELEAKIAALETRIYMLENKPCSCQATGSTIDNSNLTQRIGNLETESQAQNGLLDTIFALLIKLQGLLVQILTKSLR
jgi:hypothetical protein